MREAELDASGGKRINDLSDIVADDAEAGRLRVSLDNAAQGCLGVDRHRVGLVQDADLDWRAASVRPALNLPLRKFLDLVADDGNATLVGGVEFQNPRLVEILTEHFLRKREDSRRLASAGRSVE